MLPYVWTPKFNPMSYIHDYMMQNKAHKCNINRILLYNLINNRIEYDFRYIIHCLSHTY